MSGSPSISISISADDRATKVINTVNASITKLNKPAAAATKSIRGFGDTTGLTALSKGMRSVAGESLQAFQNIARIAPPLASIAGLASIGGIAALADQWARLNQQLGNQAVRANMSAASLNRWQGAAQLSGSSAQSMASGMTTLNDKLFLATAGLADPQTFAAFSTMNIKFKDALTGMSRTAEQVMPEIIDYISGITDPVQQSRLANALLGPAGEDLLPTIRLGTKEIARRRAEAERLNPVTKENIAAANRLSYAEQELGLSVKGLSTAIVTSLEPALTPMLHDMSDWISKHKPIVAGITEVAAGVGGLVASLKALGLAWTVLKPPPWLLAILLRTAPLTLPLALKGDTGPNSGGLSPEAADKVRKDAIAAGIQTPGQWWRSHAPTWAGGDAPAAGGTPPAGTAPPAGDRSATGQATSLIAGAEGYRSSAYWDVNHYRAGYGSDTTTDPKTGAVAPVTAATTGVTPEAARADLNRRVAGVMPAMARRIGADAWNRLSPAAQAALTSVGYNYGPERVPGSVIGAAQSGDVRQVSAAIAGLADANGGINAGRRNNEAQIALRAAEPGIGGGAGGAAPIQVEHSGGADLKVTLAGFPQGTSTSTSTSGNIFGAPPKISMAMPLGAL